MHTGDAGGFEGVDGLMSSDDAIQDFSSFYIARLLGGNDKWKDGFQVIGYDIGDDFVDDIADGYGYEIGGLNRLFQFWG